MEPIKKNRLFFQAFLLLVLSAMFLDAIGEYSRNIFSAFLFPAGGNWLGYLVAIVLLAVPFYFVFRSTARKAGKILGAEVKVIRSERQKPLEFLLMGYSPREPGPTLADMLAEIEQIGGEVVASNSEAYERVCREHKREPLKNSRWQQNLRSAWHHREKLKAIYVLDPDKDEFEDFRTYILAGLAKETMQVIRIRPADLPDMRFTVHDGTGATVTPTYEDYNYVYEGLRRGLEMIRERIASEENGDRRANFLALLWRDDPEEEADRRICVDATAGQKTFSVAAAVLTINRPLKFSYVTTFNPKSVYGEVRFYDTNLRIAGFS